MQWRLALSYPMVEHELGLFATLDDKEGDLTSYAHYTYILSVNLLCVPQKQVSFIVSAPTSTVAPRGREEGVFEGG